MQENSKAVVSVANAIESLRVHSPRLAACAVIPADAGIQKSDWMPPAYYMPGQAYQVRHDAEYPAGCGGVVYVCRASVDLLPVICDNTHQRVYESFC